MSVMIPRSVQSKHHHSVQPQDRDAESWNTSHRRLRLGHLPCGGTCTHVPSLSGVTSWLWYVGAWLRFLYVCVWLVLSF